MGTAVMRTRSPLPLQRDLNALLDFLPVLYPGGDAWLRRVLHEVAAGRADATVVYEGDVVVGVFLGSLKPGGRYKIRTLFVDDAHRRRGIGQRLLRHARRAAAAAGACEIFVTAATTIRPQFEPFIAANEFVRLATMPNRYGPGRHEDVYLSAVRTG
jgi:GNAT superfamily N-acetyltransferase